jgi:hypothetical protein
LTEDTRNGRVTAQYTAQVADDPRLRAFSSR